MRPYGPLRGRDDDLAAAMRVVRRTHDHRASGVVLITGEAGIGKTALLSEIARQGAHLGIRVARSKCDQIGQAWPGAPILGLMRAGRKPIVSSAEFEQLGVLMANPLVIVDRIAGHLQTIATTTRVLLIIDDVQWADAVSRYALRSLITRLAGWPVMWVLASRTLAEAIDGSAADTVETEHVALVPLASRTIIDIARDRLGHSVTDAHRELFDAAGGNPFLAKQIADGLARYPDAGPDYVPAEFHVALRRRVAELSGRARELLNAVAVAGCPVAHSDLVAICQVTAGSGFDTAVDEIVGSGLVASTGTEMTFVHDLIRQSTYESIDRDIRRQLHNRYASRLLPSDPAMAATHAKSAIVPGDEINARIMIDAAEVLVNTSAADATSFASDAFEMLRPGHAYWSELGERAAAVLATAQRATDAIAVIDKLLATVDDPELLFRLQTHAIKALWHNGRFTEVRERAQRTQAAAGARRDLVARFRAAQALAATRIIGAAAAMTEANAALTFARATRDRDALAFALQAAGEAANAQRRHHQALKHFRELRSVTATSYLAEEIMQLQLLDRFDDAQMLLDGADRDGRADAKAIAPAVLFAQAKQHYNLGDLASADDVSASVVELGSLIGIREQVAEAMFIRVFIALLRGEPTLAERRLALACGVLGATGGPGATFCRGWLQAAHGDTAQGVLTWSQLTDNPAESNSYSAWWPCWMPVMFEVGMQCGATDLMAKVVAIAEEAAARNPDVATLNGIALNLRGQLTDDLDVVAESVDVLRQCPRSGIRAAGTESYGLMLLRAGQRQAGLERLDQAWDEWDQMGAVGRRAAVQRVMRKVGVRRPRWSANPAGSTDPSLTDAQRRVVYLIADGHTDKAVAKTLGISANTVGTHARAAYAKLGVQSRVQLINALRARGELS